MVDQTPNHGLNKYSIGETDWTHAPDMQHIEEVLRIRDTEANLSTYEPYADAEFIATDTGAVYDGDGTNWNKATREVESVVTEYANTDTQQLNQQGKLTTWNGRLAGRGHALHDNDDWSGWTVNLGTATEDDTESVYPGGTSFRLEGNSSDNAWIQYDLPGTQDWTDKHVSFAVKWESPEDDLARIVNIMLFDSSGDWERRTAAIPSGAQGSGWVRYTPTPRDVDGTPDLTDITSIRIRSGNVGTIYLDDIRVTETTGRGKVMFTFDDANETDYTEAWDYMRRYGFRGVSAIMKNEIGNSGKLSESQTKALHDAGWDICLHPQRADSPLSSMSDDVLRETIEEEVDWLGAEDRHYETEFMAYPFGQLDDRVIEAASEYSLLGMAGGYQAVQPKTPLSPMNMPRMNMGGESLADIQAAIDKAENRGGLLILYDHTIGGSGNTSVSDFQAVVDYVADADVDVVTCSDIVDRTVADEADPEAFTDGYGMSVKINNYTSDNSWPYAANSPIKPYETIYRDTQGVATLYSNNRTIFRNTVGGDLERIARTDSAVGTVDHVAMTSNEEYIVFANGDAYAYASASDIDSDNRKASMTGVYPPWPMTGCTFYDGDNVYMWAEYTADDPADLRIIKYDTTGTFTTVHTINGRGATETDARHWHNVDRDIYNDGEFWATTGDGDSEVQWYRSTDDGDTWGEVTGAGGSQDYRTLRIQFTPDNIYWVTDQSPAKLLRATRSDPTNFTEIARWDDFTAYGMARLAYPDGFLIGLQDDGGNGYDNIPVPFYDLQEERVRTVGEFPTQDGYSRSGVEWIAPHQIGSTGRVPMRVKNMDNVHNEFWTNVEAGIGPLM